MVNFTVLKAAILAISLTLVMGSASASECSDIRLDRDDLSMSKVPVTSQGALGICYSHAAAQIVDSYRFDSGIDGHNSSALALAVTYKDSWFRRIIGGGDVDNGYTCSAIKKLLKYGSCDRDQIEKFIGNIYKLRRFSSQRRTKEYLAIIDSVYNGSDRALVIEQVENKIIKDKLIPPTKEQILRDLLWAKLPGTRKIRIRPLVFEALCTGHKQSLRDLDVICTNGANYPGNSLSCVGYECVRRQQWEEDNEFKTDIERIHELLDSSQAVKPIGIEYCSAILKNKNYTSGKWIRRRKKDCGYHASLVIGRRKHTNGKCQLLVRNSWGERCNHGYDWECDKGNIWVDDDALGRNLFNLAFLQN
ncbi:MAG: hypothetical protein ISR65_10270 [Bacteriovoracaceae bacterium]|nr:hypothetical protein [Bacteriovoracaceae bacterium]